MIEYDTIKLLRECDAGIKMGVASIDDVLDYVHEETLRKCLADCKGEHDKLKGEIQILLDKYHDDGKEPNAMAKSMSWMKYLINLEEKLAIDIRCFLLWSSPQRFPYCFLPEAQISCQLQVLFAFGGLSGQTHQEWDMGGR